jgi:hypothetical protein
MGLMVDKSVGNDVNKGEQEVAFPGGVQSKWIIGAFTRIFNSKTFATDFSGYQANPAFQGKVPHSVLGMTRVIVSCWDPEVHIDFQTSGKSNLEFLKSNGVGFVETGMSFSIVLHDSSGNDVEAQQWFINEKLVLDSHSSKLTITSPEIIKDTETIIVEAGQLILKA